MRPVWNLKWEATGGVKRREYSEIHLEDHSKECIEELRETGMLRHFPSCSWLQWN